MTIQSGTAAAMKTLAIALAVALVVAAGSAHAMPAASGVAPVGIAGEPPLHQARSVLRKLFDSMSTDDDDYVHDDHYDWQAYRDSTSRKDRVRDFYRLQTEMQKDALPEQLQAQKKMIKAQRGW
jgi:hypothetical protein